MAGSYDENIRIYKLSFVLENLSFCENKLKVDQCQLKTTIKIDGSGIWRIKKLPTRSTLLISGMYAGAYMLWWKQHPPGATFEHKLIRIDAKCKDEQSDDKEDRELIYDIACDDRERLIICISFYNRVIYYYRKI